MCVCVFFFFKRAGAREFSTLSHTARLPFLKFPQKGRSPPSFLNLWRFCRGTWGCTRHVHGSRNRLLRLCRSFHRGPPGARRRWQPSLPLGHWSHTPGPPGGCGPIIALAVNTAGPAVTAGTVRTPRSGQTIVYLLVSPGENFTPHRKKVG